MPKLTYDEALQAIADERAIARDSVRARALRRTIWLMMYSAPGCLPDHSEVCRTKQDALESARFIYGDAAPRGFITCLKRDGIAPTDDIGYYRVEVTRQTLADCF